MKTLRSITFAVLAWVAWPGTASAWQSDNGDGSYTNPVLYADYPDPDIIRVGADFYMVSTTFVNSPGINLLKSKDMVNWELVAQVASTVDGGNAYDMIGGTAYESGYWASSIRHHNGTFHVAVQPTFANGRIYHATNPAGPWSFHQLDRSIYDPGLFIDTDGTGYIVSGHGPQSLMTLSPDFSQIVSQRDNFLDSGAEGSHMVKRGSYYYVFNAKPSVWPFELRCSRTTSLPNPVWETRVALTAITGGHQGAIVDTDDAGNWFGFVHQDSGAIGRMPRIGPVFWENDWPIFGTVSNRDNMPATGTKPVQSMPLKQPASSDDFSASTLGLQWAWNHNPDLTRWSLSERPGHLRLRSTLSSSFWTARNTLTQKAQGPRSQGVVKLDLTNLQPGDIAGFGTLGKINGHIAVNVAASGAKTLSMHVIHDKVGSYTAASGVPVTGNTLHLRTDLDFVRNLGICSYSTDGANWTTLGGNFQLMFGYGSTFQGEQFALFCYNPNTATNAGHVDVDSFTLTALDDNADLVKTQRGRPRLNATRTTFVADNGQLLRGPYESTEWTTAAPQSEVGKMKDLGFNAVHLYAEVFDPNYPASGSNAPGYAVAEVDKFVQMTRDLGLYLVMTIGNGANNGNHNYQWAVDFWNFYAARYKDETHVVFEIHNEPMAWGPSYLTGTSPAGALDMEVATFNAIRTHAPDTPVLLMTYAVLGGTGGTNAALTDIHEFNQRVFGNANAVWTNEAVGFHGYAGWKDTTTAVAGLLAAGYPCMMTEFGSVDWGGGVGLDVEQTSELERLGVSWLTFQYIPPSGGSDDVSKPEHYKDLVERSGLSWTPDFGSWPVARGPFGNGGQPWKTTTDWSGDFLHGTLRIEAENFDTGGQGVAYNDGSGNSGGQYRAGESVDITGCGDTGGGYKVGWTSSGEWLEFTIWVAEPGYYDIGLRSATPNNGCTARVLCNDEDVTGDLALTNTGGYENWSTASRQVFLEFGRQKMRVEIVGGGFDINWIELSPSATGPIASGTYKLVNRNSGLAMEYDTAASNVIQNAYTGAPVQLWNLTHLGAGQYRVSSVHNNDKWNTGGGPGEKIGLVWWWGADANWQRFVVRPSGDGFYRIAAATLGLEFEPQSAAVTGGRAVVATGIAGYNGSAAQQWAIQPGSAPAIPTGLTAAYTSAGTIHLKWNPVPGASGYMVKRSIASGGPYTSISSNVLGATFTDMTVIADTGYFYVVSAIVGGIESLDSGEATAARMRARLRFDETSGTTAADATGNGWNGTLQNGPVWSTGRYGNALQLDGTNDHVTLPAGIVNGLTECTIATWVNLDTRGNWARIFDFGSDTSTYLALVPKFNDSNLPRFTIRVSGVEHVINGDTPIPLGEWAHVAVTLKGNLGILYLNGEEIGRNEGLTLSPSSLGNTTRNYLGRSQFSDPYLDGRVDELRIFTSAIGSADVLNLVNQMDEPSTPTGLAVTPDEGRLSLTWNAVADAAGYQILRATTTGGPYSVIAAGVSANAHVDDTVSPGVTYYYVVVAENAGGVSMPSLEASGVASPPPGSFCFAFDETSGITGQDALGSGWSAALQNGAGWTSGYRAGAVALDGADDHVSLPTGVMSGVHDFTIAAWVKPDALSSWSRIFDFGSGTDNYMFLTPKNSFTNTPRFAIRTHATGEQTITSSVPLAAGSWNHVAVTLSGSVGTLYINGEAVGTNPAMTLTPADLGATPANLIGKSQWPDPYFDGKIDDLRIDSRAWSTMEISSLARMPFAHLTFGEGSGTMASDVTGNGWNGTLVNGPVWSAGWENPGAVELDGNDDHVALPGGVVAGLEGITIAAWVRLDSVPTWSRIFDFGTASNNYMFLTPSAGGTNAVRFAIRTPGVGEEIIDGTAALPVGQWTHVAVTLSGGSGALYVNGVAVGTKSGMTLTPASLRNTTANFIGKSQWADPHLDGRVDDFRIYGRSFDATSIQALASEPPVLPPVTEEELRAPTISQAGGQVVLHTMTSVTGRVYQLETSVNPASDWRSYGDPVVGNGQPIEFVVPLNPEFPKRFFRIRIGE